MPSNVEKSKTGVPFVRFYGNDWFTGTVGMKADERGVYISLCVYIWTTGRRVPLDDAEASRMMGLQFNNYQRLRDRLVVKGKVQKHGDGYGVERAEKELDLARDRSAAGNANGDGRRSQQAPESSQPARTEAADCSGSEACESTEADSALLGAPIGTLAGTPIGAPIGEVEKSEEILRANKEPITNNQKESPKPQINWSTHFAPADENHGVIVSEGGSVLLVNGTKDYWLERFGSEIRLDLALKQVSVQANSRQTAKAQIERQLGRIAAEKLDKDERYQVAVASNAAQRDKPKPVKASRW